MLNLRCRICKKQVFNEEMTEKKVQWAHDLIALYHDQLSFGAEIVELSAQFFKDEIEYDEESQAVLAGNKYRK